MLLLCLAALPAFAGGSSGSGTAGEAVVLSVVWSNEGDIPGAGDWFDEMASGFHTQYPNVRVEVAEHTIDQLMPSWQAAVEAQSGPDVQFFWTGVWCLEDVWAGNVENLGKWIPESERRHWTHTEGVTYDGKVWFAPWYNFALPAMVYNKNHFRSAGLNPDSPPATWQEFLSACEAVSANGTTGFTFGLKDAWGAEPVYALLGPATIDDIREIKLAATEPGAFERAKHKDWLVKLHELFTKGYLNSDIMSVNYIPGRDSFFDGSAAFGQIMSGRMVDMKNLMGDRDVVDFMKVPKMGPGKLSGRENTQTQAFGIPVFSKHKQEAADFIVYMHQAENVNRQYEITHFFPSDGRFDPDLLSTEIEKDYWKAYSRDAVPYFGLYLPTMVISEGIYVAAQMVCSGSTPDEAGGFIEEIAERWRTLNPQAVTNFENWAK
jgi:ABC-type glycerol-3-phosphate transport system substrate-binding protein